MAVVMDLQFDSLLKAKNWWSVFDQDPNVLSTVGFVDDGANSRIEIDIAERGAAIAAVQKAYPVKADSYVGEFTGLRMDEDLTPDAGTIANCYDPDPTKRGRYIKVGASGTGSWSLQSPTIVDKCWGDNNHPERLLELLLSSWIATTPPHPGSGPQAGWVTPPANDWRNAVVTFDMRCQDLYLGKWSKIAQHVQGTIDDLTALLPANVYATPNFILTKDLISDQLGFGNDGWGKPNKVERVYDSGRRDVVLNYSADDADWRCLGSITRPLSYYHYVVTPVAQLLQNLVGNSYMMAVHDKPQPDDQVFAPVGVDVAEKDRIAGKLLIYGIKVEVPDV
ncbi:hypothetical protein [Sphingomonas sp. 37zxx]|uniref:hypothetical protein n=1 Tax=Sphingomonas sp. 37zxx TaxID=1550073 RepID=UPI00053BF559|nr:hypothetical protein [Sphingomonas sp. 37zxx]